MEQARKTVGIVMPLGSQQGGAEALLRHLLQHGSTRFRYVCAFFQEGTIVEEARHLGFRVVVIPATRLTRPGNYLRSVLALRRWIKTEKIDLVFSWMPKAHLYAGPASFGTQAKVIWYQHGAPEGDPLDRIATRIAADAVLCCSKTSERAQHRLSPKRRTFVSYPGVAIRTEGLLSQAEARAQLGLPLEPPVICMVARLERWKGVHIFVAAAEQIFDRFPDAVLTVVGGAHPGDLAFAEDLAEQVSRLSRPGQFLLAGQKSMPEVATWQMAADLIVHPVTGIEAFGMVVPEAMALGRVVIASDAGGPAEVIEDGTNGLLVSREDAQKLAKAVVQLLENPARRKLIEAGARRRAQSFSVPAFAHRMDDLLAEIMEEV